jgi:hypothetical protein
VVACLAVLAMAIALIIFWFCCRPRRRLRQEQTPSPFLLFVRTICPVRLAAASLQRRTSAETPPKDEGGPTGRRTDVADSANRDLESGAGPSIYVSPANAAGPSNDAPPPRYTSRRPSLASTDARSIRKYLGLVGFPGDSRTSFSSSLSAADASSEFGAVPYRSNSKRKSSALASLPSLRVNVPAAPVPSIPRSAGPRTPKPMGPRSPRSPRSPWPWRPVSTIHNPVNRESSISTVSAVAQYHG